MPTTRQILDVLDDYVDFKIEYDKEVSDEKGYRWHQHMSEKKHDLTRRLDEALGEYVTAKIADDQHQRDLLR